MPILADTVDLVIGVDPHKHTHTAAIVVAANGNSSRLSPCLLIPTGSPNCWLPPIRTTDRAAG